MNIFVSFLVTFLTIVMTLFGGFMPAADVPDGVQDDFVPVLRFVAASDTHVITLGDTGCRRITNMMKQAYAYSDAHSAYNTVDAVIFAGDITDDGSMSAFSAFAVTTDYVLRDETTRLAVAAKSHDCNMYGKDALAVFEQVTGQTSDVHAVINGYHFIGLSTSHEEAHYTETQIEWLDTELAAAVADAPLQPVFVFQHEHIADTVFGSYDYDGWGVPYFNDVLAKYPQVIDISGHSHYPANDPRSIWQGSFTAIGDGGLSYAEFTVDDLTSVHPDKCKTVAQSLIIEVDAYNRVLVKVLDITANKILCSYLIDNVASPVKLKYSHAVRGLAAKAPEFAQDAALSFRKGVVKSEITTPQASVEQGNEVYLYRLRIENEAGDELYAAWELSQYYFAQRPETITFSFSMPDDAARAVVVAEDVWGKQSEPLVCEF